MKIDIQLWEKNSGERVTISDYRKLSGNAFADCIIIPFLGFLRKVFWFINQVFEVIQYTILEIQFWFVNYALVTRTWKTSSKTSSVGKGVQGKISICIAILKVDKAL